MEQEYTDTCESCGAEWIPNAEQLGYQWTCDKCRTPAPCHCGSDDVVLDWHIVTDPNGLLCPDPAWAAECQMCELITPYFLTAKEAADYWNEFCAADQFADSGNMVTPAEERNRIKLMNEDGLR